MNQRSDEDDDRDEKRIEAMLSSTGKDAPPPDQAFLARLRDQSTQAFLVANSQATQQTPKTPEVRRRLMFQGTLRWAASAAAACLLLAGGFFVFFADKGPDLGTVLQQAARADSLHIKVARDGKSSELWALKGGKMRWNEGDTYQIARDGRLWLIDEKAKKKTPRMKPYFFEEGKAGLDVFALLDLNDDARALLAKQRPDGTVTHDGHKCYHYRAESGKIRLDALVDVATQHLVSLEVSTSGAAESYPLATLTILAWNQPVDEDKFVVKDGLAEDMRVGKLTDVQGVVSVKPVMHDRWTPVRAQLPLKPGDWIQTDPRGANAAAFRMEKAGQIIVGPGSLVELVTATQVRVHQGILEITAPDKAGIEVIGPFKKTVTVEGKQLFKVEQDKLVRVPKEPLWLKGFKGTTTNDAVGSLIANVEGRNVALTVGYHKVSVDIRDQIARTTIEESFVNHTNAQLEGIFNFPLPQDASISGFGMWIGNNLIEADVVEKQRAREIYETIRSENRDPGLLEWNGGNIFTARVWPIFAHSEKRIKITYTQVLPLRGDKFTYSYALQSEMLKQHPLKDLSIDVKISSAVPIKSVECPSHTTRSDKTKNSAHVEFAAKEYTPERDFEVITEIDGAKLPIVLVPHRRGDDGYFLMQVMPPASFAVPDRSILANGKALNLILLADTSASMDARQRSEQAAFLAALLTSLTPKDTFNLGACDVDTSWVFSSPKPATSENVRNAREFLNSRSSLGWTDLDRAFASAFKQTDAETNVIYIGDGVSTAKDTDPNAFVKRLRKMYEKDGKGAVHAVAVGSTHDMTTLKAMGSLGGGSVRRVGGEQTPSTVARELLDEVAQPSLRDVKIEFSGVRTARVYPEQLPNVPAGSQQIVLGRYLPEGGDKPAEVIVTGTLDGKPVRYTAPVVLKDAESGNSFIPRLWARMHLDVLLEQGTSETVKDEIISLSEEYNIITPYTSFLVLETDADRERFKVKRRFQMKDGEKFFAQGRDNVNYDLTQKQMKKAGTYRIGLRNAVLRKFATLGRDPNQFSTHPRRLQQQYRRMLRQGDGEWGSNLGYTGGLGGAGGGMDKSGEMLGEEPGLDPSGPTNYYLDRIEDVMVGGAAPAAPPMEAAEKQLADMPFPGDGELDRKELGDSNRELERLAKDSDFDDLRELKKLVSDEQFNGRAKRDRAGFFAEPESKAASWVGGFEQPRIRWFEQLVSRVPAAPHKVKEPADRWPAEARDLARSLLRDKQLAALKGGLALTQRTEIFDVRRGNLSIRHDRTELVSAKTWYIRDESDRGPAMVQWVDAKERGLYNRPLGLGRTRAAVAADHVAPLNLGDYSLYSLDRTYRTHDVKVEKGEGNRTTLVLAAPHNPKNVTRVAIDTEKHVVLIVEQVDDGKVVSTTKFSDFVEAGGCWWAGSIVTTNDKGKKSETVTSTVKELSGEGFDKAWQTELEAREKVQFFRQPLPNVSEAKRALAADKATFEDRITLMLHFAQSQQWARAEEHFAQAEKLSSKPGMRWLAMGLVAATRRNDELRQRLNAEAERLAKLPADQQATSDVLFIANHLLGQAPAVLGVGEVLALLDRVAPIATRQPAHRRVARQWAETRINYLPADQALRLLKTLATEFPHDASLQYQYAQRLGSSGEYAAAYSWITGLLKAEGAPWSETEEDSFRTLYTGLLEQQGRFSEIVDYTTEWAKKDTAGGSAYSQLLSALVKTDQEKKADELIDRWLKEGQKAGDLSPATQARLYAAVRQAIGQGHNLYTNRIEAKWVTPLAETALACARRPQTFGIVNNIVHQYGFTATDECRRFRKTIAEELLKNLDSMSIAQLNASVEWVLPNDPDLGKEKWSTIASSLRKRWAAEKKVDDQEAIGRTLVTLLSQRGMTDEVLAFLRTQLKDGSADYKLAHARQLYDHILSKPWTVDFENEAFTLLDQVSEASDLSERIGYLHRLTDRLVEGRVQARNAALEHPEKLTRKELAEKGADFRKEARAAVADRLRLESARHGKYLTSWFVMEAGYLDTQSERDLKRVVADCWNILGDKPKAPAPATVDDDEDDDNHANQAEVAHLDAILRNRCLLTLGNLAARKGADAELATRLFKYFDDGSTVDPDNAASWKTFTYEMLLALDRAKDLETTLGQWVKADATQTRWRLALGYLLAEQGRIAEAITLFEKVEASDELASTAYKALADWYMIVDRRDAHEKAKVAMFKTMPEHQLARMIQMKLNQHTRTESAPPALEKDTLHMFEALFAKATYPANHLYVVQAFYQATHDFRLLTGLADAVVGQTAGRVYPFLQGMRGVLEEVRDEATADEIFAAIDNSRKRAKTDVDKRALDLLEMLLRWRSARLKNQPGPHADAALVAFRRAVKPAWTEGEPRLMADLLMNMGVVEIPALAKEQLKVLEDLYKGEKAGTVDRLYMAHRYGQTLNAYARRDAAADLLQSALKEFQQAHDNVLPPSANEVVNTYVSVLGEMRAYARAEKFLQEHRKVPFPQHQALWLQMKIYEVYQHALDNEGEVSLGKGQDLYQAFEKAVIADLGTTDQNHRITLISVLTNLYRQAHKQGRDGCDGDLRAFAFGKLPELLKANPIHYEQVVSTIASTVRDVLGAADGVTFLVNTIEKEPRWLRLNNQDGWNRHAWNLAVWRSEAGKKLPDEVQGRLLRLVLAELRLDLESMQQRSRAIYFHNNQHYWPEKEEEFIKVAEDVLGKRLQSGAAVQYLADYFFWGVQRQKRAIEILQAAHAQKLLNEGGRFKLVDFLFRENRHGESIALLVDLIKDQPGNLNYRTHLMTAYHRTSKKVELAATLKEADEYFHKEGRWQEYVMAALGHACLECGLLDACVAYYKELIPLHQRTHARRGAGDGTLANYYLDLARAYAGLKKTPEAVEAACGAIVSWGPHFNQRQNALTTLHEVLRDSANLDAFITEIDQKGAETGMDSAIVRKAIGEVLFDKGQFEKATIQLRRAAELQPNNTDVNKKLLECFDKRNDKAGAAAQILASVQLSRRDLNLYQELGKRYTDQGKNDEAERAFTSIVEMMPTDASSHMMLAGVREGQNRWDDAVRHWEEAVRLRTMEPNPLLGLAKAQIHQAQLEKASQTVAKLKGQQWPARFTEVRKQIGEVEKLLNDAKNK